MSKANLQLADLAAMQHGSFTTAQAMELGLTSYALRNLVMSGWCERVATGVFRIRGAPRTERQEISMAVLSAGPQAVASRRSALHVWGGKTRLPRLPEVSVPHKVSAASQLTTIHRSLWLPSDHVTVEDGIAVTTPARTIFDLGATRSLEQLRIDADDLVQRKVCTIGEIKRLYYTTASRGRPGSKMMGQLIKELTDDYIPPASQLERDFRRLLVESGIEQPRFEVNLGSGKWIGRVDAYWDWAYLVAEVDGRRYHGGLTARDRDRQRDNELMALGLRVLRFTWGDIKTRASWVGATVIAALGAAR